MLTSSRVSPGTGGFLSKHRGSSSSLWERKTPKKTLVGVGKACPKPWYFVVMLAAVASSSEVSNCLQ